MVKILGNSIECFHGGEVGGMLHNTCKPLEIPRHSLARVRESKKDLQGWWHLRQLEVI